MKPTSVYLLIYIFIFGLTGCSKEDSTKDEGITIQSLSGTYGLNALIWKSGSVSVDVYDQLDECRKDNLIKLNVDKTVEYIDAGIVCSPPENDNGTWDLQGDSLYFTSTGIPAKIKSFDGKILILTGNVPNEPGVSATTTLEKK